MDPDPPPSSRRLATDSGLRALARKVWRVLRLWRLYFLRVELRFAPTETQRLFVLTVAIGAACGLAAVAFELALRFLTSALIDRALDAPGHSWLAWTIATPVLGAAACGVLLQYAAPGVRGSGIANVRTAFVKQGGRLRLRDSVAKFAISALQIGSGGSLGPEGPVVHICGGVASWLARLARVSPRSLRRMMPVGAAAGIAAAFNAPIAAVTFTIEEIIGQLDQSVLSGVIVAATFAAVIERAILGAHPMFSVPSGFELSHASSLLVYALLGIGAAFVSLAFTESMLLLRSRFSKTKALPGALKPAVGGLVTGVLAILAVLALQSRGVTGSGYDTLEQALLGKVALRAMIALCAMKVVATAFSYGTGGAGGLFAPSLFMGGMLGGAVGGLDMLLFGHESSEIGAFAMCGMGAVFAGVFRAPMTAVLLIVELTGGYGLMLPLMLASTLSYALARKIRPIPIFEALMAQDGITLRDAALLNALESADLEPLIHRDRPFVRFELGTHGAALLRPLHAQDAYPVVDASEQLVGVVAREDIELAGETPELEPLVTAADLMRPPVAVRLHDDLHTALDTMLASGVRWLPVIDEQRHVAGFVDEASIAHVYLRQHTQHH